MEEVSIQSVQGGGHHLSLYSDDRELTAAVGTYLRDAYEIGGELIVIATPSHRHAFAAALPSNVKNYTALDAAETLDKFMRDGHPDGELFAATVGALVAKLCGTRRPVFAFGEMVSLLWEQGNILGALELETLWNELAEVHHFTLYCAYHMPSITVSDDLTVTKLVCDHHSSVIPMAAPMACEGDDTNCEHLRLFMPTASELSAVREFVRAAAVDLGRGRLSEPLAVIATELATNAIQHARSPFHVHVAQFDDGVRLAVRDASPVPLRSATPTLHGGRGLMIVAALSHDWGSAVTSDGKTVWADLRD